MFGSDKILEATDCGTLVMVKSEDLYNLGFSGARTVHYSGSVEDTLKSLNHVVKKTPGVDCLLFRGGIEPGYLLGVYTISLLSLYPLTARLWFGGILAQFELQQRNDKPEDRITHPGFLTIAKTLWEREIQYRKVLSAMTEEGNRLSIMCEGDLACDLDP